MKKKKDGMLILALKTHTNETLPCLLCNLLISVFLSQDRTTNHLFVVSECMLKVVYLKMARYISFSV